MHIAVNTTFFFSLLFFGPNSARKFEICRIWSARSSLVGGPISAKQLTSQE